MWVGNHLGTLCCYAILPRFCFDSFCGDRSDLSDSGALGMPSFHRGLEGAGVHRYLAIWEPEGWAQVAAGACLLSPPPLCTWGHGLSGSIQGSCLSCLMVKTTAVWASWVMVADPRTPNVLSAWVWIWTRVFSFGRIVMIQLWNDQNCKWWCVSTFSVNELLTGSMHMAECALC